MFCVFDRRYALCAMHYAIMNKHLPYDRAERVGDEILQLVSRTMLTDISDPRLEGIQITRVRMTRDLRIARIYYHIYDISDERKEEVERAFAKAAGFFRRVIGAGVVIKFTPEVEFYYDDSIDLGEKIDKLMAGEGDDTSNG